MKRVFLISIIYNFFCLISLNAQNTNYRAQGNYYSAREELGKENYQGALDYINSSKKYLGGTNYQLQYMHIVTAYRAKLYLEAQMEMKKYFKIQSGEIKAVEFDKSVDPLTSDEVKELTKLIDKIDQAVIKEIGYDISTMKGFCDMLNSKIRYAGLSYSVDKHRNADDKLNSFSFFVKGKTMYLKFEVPGSGCDNGSKEILANPYGGTGGTGNGCYFNFNYKKFVCENTKYDQVMVYFSIDYDSALHRFIYEELLRIRNGG